MLVISPDPFPSLLFLWLTQVRRKLLRQTGDEVRRRPGVRRRPRRAAPALEGELEQASPAGQRHEQLRRLRRLLRRRQDAEEAAVQFHQLVQEEGPNMALMLISKGLTPASAPRTTWDQIKVRDVE